LNSSNDRRVYDGVSSCSKFFEPAPHQARRRPEDNLSAALFLSRPKISITSNRSETFFGLINLRPTTRFAFELNRRVARLTHNSKRKFDQQKTLTPSPGTLKTIAPKTEVNQQALLGSSFQEI
jgi:hypothetical protein